MTLCAIGVDPGLRWTGLCLLVDDTPVYGCTLGPTDADGAPDRTANDEADPVAVYRYAMRVLAEIEP